MIANELTLILYILSVIWLFQIAWSDIHRAILSRGNNDFNLYLISFGALGTAIMLGIFIYSASIKDFTFNAVDTFFALFLFSFLLGLRRVQFVNFKNFIDWKRKGVDRRGKLKHG